MPTKISWTDESWNPVTGCTPISEGCAHCYAKRMTKRFGGDFSKVTLHPDRLEIPLHWKKPRMVFVPSMGDLFHEDVPWTAIGAVWETMRKAEQHTFQVLTKRPERMRQMVVDIVGRPLPNVWLGVSVENQARADERIPVLLETPAAVRFVSAEPLLGPLNLWHPLNIYEHNGTPCCTEKVGWHPIDVRPDLDWVIVGGESGGPPERRLVERCGPVNLEHWARPSCSRCDDTGWCPKPEAREWVRDIREQCQAAGVAFFFKQWGGPTPKSGGRLLDGREHKGTP